MGRAGIVNEQLKEKKEVRTSRMNGLLILPDRASDENRLSIERQPHALLVVPTRIELVSKV
jgi:hypothetical protein